MAEGNKRTQATRLRKEHSQWRDEQFASKAGFFPVFYDLKDYLNHLSSGGISLFIYLGLHSNNQTGECYHDLKRIAKYFNKSTRTISTWFKELEDAGLIEKLQLEPNTVAHTFIRPYSKRTRTERDNDK